jgi:prohibitin 2
MKFFDSTDTLGRDIFIVGIFGLAIIFSIMSIAIVPAGYKGVVLTWGAVTGTSFEAGIHFITPIAQSVQNMNVRTQKFEALAEAATADLLDVSTNVAVNYHIDSTKANDIYQNLGLNYQENVISPAVQEVVKSSTANFNAKELITNRAKVKQTIDDALQQRLIERGIILETTSITDFNFPTQFNDAITAAQTSTQQVEKAKNDLQRITVEAQQAVAQAKGIAESKVVSATAEAEAIDIINQQLSKSPTYIQWQSVTKWNGVMPNIVPANAIPFINVPTA